MTSRLRVLVADDEELAREGVRRLLEREPDIEVVGECGDGRTAAAMIIALAPDIVFLDVQMPEMDGFETLRAIAPGRMPAIVFVTAFDRYALKAFDVHALDYLLKPFDDKRFTLALERAKADIRQSRNSDVESRLTQLLDAVARGPAHPGLTRLVVKAHGRVTFVKADEIDWIEAADYYVKLHVAGKVHLLRETMGNLEASLDSAMFFRVHRSAIVNLDRVKEVQQYFHGEHILILRDGSKLRMTRGRRSSLEAILGQSL